MTERTEFCILIPITVRFLFSCEELITEAWYMIAIVYIYMLKKKSS